MTRRIIQFSTGNVGVLSAVGGLAFATSSVSLLPGVTSG